MTKTKLLTPILTIGTLGAVVTPMTVLTSCGSNIINIAAGYTCELTPAPAKSYTKAEALNAYFDAMSSVTSNDADYKVLKDDARYSYSLGLNTQNFKSLGGKFSTYTLDFEDIYLDKPNKQMSLKFVISVKGSYDDDYLTVSDADFTCKFWMDKPFDLEFNKADSKATIENKNFISFTPSSAAATYKLTGSCKIGNVEYKFLNETNTCDISKYPEKESSAEVYCGYMVKQFVLTGLTCNYVDMGEGEKGGALYTNYMSLAEITD